MSIYSDTPDNMTRREAVALGFVVGAIAAFIASAVAWFAFGSLDWAAYIGLFCVALVLVAGIVVAPQTGSPLRFLSGTISVCILSAALPIGVLARDWLVGIIVAVVSALCCCYLWLRPRRRAAEPEAQPERDHLGSTP